jgi:glycosyltransferase involved in cell wall biosynthesis
VDAGASPEPDAAPRASRSGRLAVVIPAKDEADRITTTIEAALTIEGVSLIVVVDDGSSDATAERALAAGAQVASHERNRGKAAAMETGAARVAMLDEAADEPRALLFIDADLGHSAVAAGMLAEPVLAGEADMTIALIPPQATVGGGSGRVVRLARRGIHRATGWTATQPLSGNRCLSRKAFNAAVPLAPGWGVETGLTIDLIAAGFRVIEVPCELHHRVTGTDVRAQLHRAKQYRDVWRALLSRRIARLRTPRS